MVWYILYCLYCMAYCNVYFVKFIAYTCGISCIVYLLCITDTVLMNLSVQVMRNKPETLPLTTTFVKKLTGKRQRSNSASSFERNKIQTSTHISRPLETVTSMELTNSGVGGGVHSGVGDSVVGNVVGNVDGSVGGSIGGSVVKPNMSSQQNVTGQPTVADYVLCQQDKRLAGVSNHVGNRLDGDLTSTHYHNPNQADDIGSDEGMRERSTTPIESDLLKYLTANITPSDPGGLTSFVISREEYLRGIVQLVKSDCPEVVDNIDSFTTAMQQAFNDCTTHAHIPCV
jgi:hypothetical protein